MDLLSVVLLSIVEGLTEFLPISSTGHLILASKLLNIPTTDFLKTFEIAIQLGAIMAIVVLYFKKFITSFEIYKKLFVAFLPSVVVGFFLYPFIKEVLLGSSNITLASLFVGGLVLIFYPGKDKGDNKISYKDAFKVGLFQSISVIPGVSRAAATILGGMFSGLSRSIATEFSFLLAVPTMLAATALDLYKTKDLLIASDFKLLGIGMVLSFIFAMMAVKFLIKYIKTHDFKGFGVYRILLAVIIYLVLK